VKGKGNNYDLEDIIKCINNSTIVADKEKGYTSQTRRAMVSRFEIAKQWGIFSIEGTPLINLSVPDQLTVIDVSMLDENLHALITGILARKVLRARLHASRHTEAAKIALPDDLTFAKAGHLFHGPVPGDHLLITIYYKCSIGQEVYNGGELLMRGLQLIFCLLRLCDIFTGQQISAIFQTDSHEFDYFVSSILAPNCKDARSLFADGRPKQVATPGGDHFLSVSRIWVCSFEPISAIGNGFFIVAK
jgi:hypothetical protein